MKNIAIVEDNERDFLSLKENIESYAKDHHLEFSIDWFATSTLFLDSYSPKYEIVFMDIELPDVDGINASKELREKDKNVIIVFVTNLANCAIKGYEVNAFDFIVKPINKFSFSTMFSRALLKRETTRSGEILIKNGRDSFVLSSDSIFYIEVKNHKLIYHTSFGDFTEWGKLNEIEKKMEEYNFVKANSYLLINLKYVKSIQNNYCEIGNEKLPLSRNKKKDVVESLVRFISGR